MDVRWIEQQIEARGMTRRRLAEGIGLTEVQLSKVMGGTRRLTAEEADAIRHFFGYRLPEDPPRSDLDLIQDYISHLDEQQKRSVILYLEALAGAPLKRPQAS